jgi:HAE1 family hydrophobic/amphiphilic exporter-1
LPRDILKLYVKNDRDEMVPYSMKLEKSMDYSELLDIIYTSTEISGSAASGYSSGTAIKVIQVAAEKLPRRV